VISQPIQIVPNYEQTGRGDIPTYASVNIWFCTRVREPPDRGRRRDKPKTKYYCKEETFHLYRPLSSKKLASNCSHKKTQIHPYIKLEEVGLCKSVIEV